MKSIGFKNFRRFTEFPDFKFGDVTILVGANNTGKSTLAKAMDFIICGIHGVCTSNGNNGTMGGLFHRKFNLNFPIGKLGEYDRTHCNKTEDSLEFTIEFGESKYLTTSRFKIYMQFEKGQSHDVKLDINSIIVEDREAVIKYSYLPDSFVVSASSCPNEQIEIGNYEDEQLAYEDYQKNVNNQSAKIDSYLKYLRDILDRASMDDYIDGNLVGYENAYNRNYIARLNRIYENFRQKENKFDINLYFKPYTTWSEFPIRTSFAITRILEELGLYNECFDEEKVKIVEASTLRSKIEERIEDSIIDLEKAIKRLRSLQLPIHSLEKVPVFTYQHPMFSLISGFLTKENQHKLGAIEKRGIAAGACRVYYETYGDVLREFFKDFGIAKDYRIGVIAGEIYTFDILDFSDNWVRLADIGTGSIRLIEIFLFIINADNTSTLFIEEPEQNLHPKLQSKLADFFLKVKNELGIKIIVETHSEYLIRRSQVLVAEMNLSEEELDTKNPFKVYYFPEDSVPYDMKYTTSGRFEKNFGEGFFDEASVSALTLSRLERRKKDDWN